jgi:phosphate transport system permease protein
LSPSPHPLFPLLPRLVNDQSLRALLRACALCVALIMLLILGYITHASWSFLQTPGAWLATNRWHPLENTFGLLPMLAATLLSSALAMLMVIPLGLILAIWGRFYAHPALAAPFRVFLGLMASIPSVVYGLWGLVVLVPIINRIAPPGASLLAGVFILALMILPILVLQADLALHDAADQHLAPALALGLSHWAAIRNVLLPSSLPQLLPAVLLQTGRALGETMAVLMVCGNVAQWPHSLFAPVRTLTANIALEMAYATSVHQTALFTSGWLLMLLVLTLMLGARHLQQRQTQYASH